MLRTCKDDVPNWKFAYPKKVASTGTTSGNPASVPAPIPNNSVDTTPISKQEIPDTLKGSSYAQPVKV
jgi:hypothetical protein